MQNDVTLRESHSAPLLGNRWLSVGESGVRATAVSAPGPALNLAHTAMHASARTHGRPIRIALSGDGCSKSACLLMKSTVYFEYLVTATVKLLSRRDSLILQFKIFSSE